MGILFGGFDEFQTPRLPPPAIPLPYLVLTVLSLITLLPPLVLAASSRDSGHPALVNLLVSFFIYLLASGLVVFSQGGRIEEFPSLSLCLVQGSMMVAGTPSLTMTAATYIFFLYATLQTSKKWLTSFVLSKRGTLALVILPWVVYVLVFVLALIIGHRHPDKVFLRDLYCVVFVDGLAVIRFIGSLIFLIIALASAVSVSVVVFQKHALERRRRAASSATGFGTDPLRLDLWILLEAWSIGAFFLTVALLLARTLKVHTSIPADVMASTG
ncbi:hypothetical protein BDY24DRAFT_428927 [Mrakia frigida]|uniref:uncharacterized protein n=1 Tax=Mrakia frigida TaxID=29902 RepID=UPI003FCBF4F1